MYFLFIDLFSLCNVNGMCPSREEWIHFQQRRLQDSFPMFNNNNKKKAFEKTEITVLYDQINTALNHIKRSSLNLTIVSNTRKRWPRVDLL